MANNQAHPGSPEEASNSVPEAPTGKRLDSWKEIAVYLQRGIRTVKRWEKNEGMPVHRHHHDRQASVYAYEEELEAWRENRRQTLDAEEDKPPRKRTLLWAGLVAATVLVMVVAGGLIWRSRAPVLPFAKRDWVLISSFENRTGEEVFDGTLEYALEQELSNSHFVNVVPRERINDTLKLMERPLNTTIDAKVGREICIRDGGIRALITGRVRKLGTTYVLSAELVNPASGVTVASFSEEATGHEDVAPAVRQLANHVRRTLGEELASIESTGQRLAKVTTPSLRALHLFTQADAVIARTEEGNVTAEQLLREAIAEDPRFASAYMHLAFALRNEGRPPEEYQPYARKAFELSKTSSERERYFILGAYHSMMGEDEQAVAAYRTLVQLYPNDYWGNNNLIYSLVRLGRFQEAVRYRVKMAELQPHDFGQNVLAGWALVNSTSNSADAQPYLERARQLLSPKVRAQFKGMAAWLELLPFCESWRQGRMQEAQTEVDRIAQRLDSLPEPARDEYARSVGGAYLTLGKLKSAEEMYGSITNKDDLAQGLAMVAWARNDRRAMGVFLRHAPASYLDVMLLSRAGFPNLAREAMPPVKPPRRPGPINPQALRQTALGHLALARGKMAEAIQDLKDGFGGLQGVTAPYFFLAADALAQAYEKQGQKQSALQVLERASRERKQIADPGVGAFWMLIESHRAKLLRDLDREREAAAIESEMRRFLALADSDDFLLRSSEGNAALATKRLAQP